MEFQNQNEKDPSHRERKKHQPPKEITLGGTSIKCKEDLNYLEIYIDRKLRWKNTQALAIGKKKKAPPSKDYFLLGTHLSNGRKTSHT